MQKLKRALSLLAIGLLGLTLGTYVSWAPAHGQRFLQLRFGSAGTITFDLATVQLLQPGRFTIKATTMDDPDVMRFKLGVLKAAHAFCAHGVGKYSMPRSLLTLGPPDMPIRDIVVAKTKENWKYVLWSYPYLRLAIGSHEYSSSLNCGRGSDYGQLQDAILNGLRDKELFDCDRGLSGTFLNQNDDPTKAITGFVPAGSIMEHLYYAVCRAVTHTEPYKPHN